LSKVELGASHWGFTFELHPAVINDRWLTQFAETYAQLGAAPDGSAA